MSSSSVQQNDLLVLKIGNLPQNLKNEQVIPILVKLIGSSQGLKKAVFKRNSTDYLVHIRFTNKTYINSAYSKLFGKYINGTPLLVQYSNDVKLEILSIKSKSSIKGANYLLNKPSIKVENTINTSTTQISNKKRKWKIFKEIDDHDTPSKKKIKSSGYNNNNSPPPLPPPPPPPASPSIPAPSMPISHQSNLLDQFDQFGDSDYESSTDISENELHKKKISKTTFKYECKDCNKTFLKACVFESHFKIIHYDKWPYKCNYINCDKCYTAKYNLILHILNIHKDMRDMKVIKKKKKHIKIKTKIKIPNKNRKKIGIVNINPGFKCKYCDQIYVYHHILKQHLCAVHDDDTWVKHKCNYCNKKYYSLFHYKEHIRTHTGERPYVCDKCGETFPVNNSLRNHLKRVHDIHKEFECEHCQQIFYETKDFEIHSKRIHGELYPYKCNYFLCDTQYKTNHGLIVHIALKHKTNI